MKYMIHVKNTNNYFLAIAIICTLFINIKSTAQITAKKWNANVIAGWNLGNQFECSAPGMDNESMAIGNPDGAIKAETAWKNPKVTRRVIQEVRKAGFNAIRIPIRWQCHITNQQAMSIDKEWLNRIKEVVGWCFEQDMQVIINVHHEKWLEGRPTESYQTENCQKLALLWFNIASEFANYDHRLAFAGTNEVHIKDNWGKPSLENLKVQNSYNQTFVDVVRATGGNNEKRHLIVQTYACNAEYGLDGNFIIPKDIQENNNDYLSVEFHYYTPWEYAGECKYYFWGEKFKKYGTIPSSDEKQMEEFMNRVVDTWSSKGLGVVIGEWGVTDHYKGDSADIMHQNMSYYCQQLVSKARKRGFSTFIWDNNYYGNGSEIFGIMDRSHGMKINCPWIMEGIFNAISNTDNK